MLFPVIFTLSPAYTISAKGYVVLGVSVDSPKSHKKFIEKYGLGFTLISDEDHSVVEAYGVWVEKSMYGRRFVGPARAAYLVARDGTVGAVVPKVEAKDHAEQLRALIRRV